jgi:hypothetical protein
LPKWPESMVDALRALTADGFSTAATADALCVKFGVDITRNMVVGKRYRMGLVAPPDIEPVAPPRKRGADKRERRPRALHKPAPIGACVQTAPRPKTWKPGRLLFNLGFTRAT